MTSAGAGLVQCSAAAAAAQAEPREKDGPGIGLFSQRAAPPVSSTLERFTAVFGMGTGGTTPLETPGPVYAHCQMPGSWAAIGPQSNAAPRPRICVEQEHSVYD